MTPPRLPARILVDAAPLLQGKGRARGLAYVATTLVDGLRRIPDAPPVALVDPVRGTEHPLAAAPMLEPLPDAWSSDHRPGMLRYQAAQTLFWASHPPGPGEVVLFLAHNVLPLVLPRRSAVVVHDLISSAWAPWAAGRKLGALRDRLLACRLAGATHLIAVSGATRADMERLLGLPGARISVIHDSVLDPAPAGDAPTPRLAALAVRHPRFVLWLGAKEPRKGLGELLEAWGRGPAGPSSLVVAGLSKAYDQGIERVYAAALASRPDLAAVHDLDEREKSWLLARAEVLAFPSRYEGFGLPLVEAMAVGTPAVTFANSSLPEVCGDAGILVPDGDFAGLVEAVRSLAADPARRAALAALCRSRAAAFTTEVMARAYLATLARVAVA